ncbi:MAG: amino acid ABC transporter substrate-binding protein [Thermoleophilia bacterium]|nr:amino acid ABC transporter substrate-binding protein [Thermoleophilia bacterium]
MKKSRLLTLMAALMLVAVMAFAVGCGSDDSSDSSSSDDISSELITEGTLTVGSDIPFPPFEFGKAPAYDGFDIDMVNEIASRLDLDVAIKDTSFDTIFTDVAQGKFDVVASASTITPDREKTVNFSAPYYEAEQALLVPEGSDIATVKDLDGRTVGSQDGTTGEAYANDETDAGSVRGFPNGPAAIAALKAGQVEATIIDQPVAQDAIDKGQTGFEIATVIPTGELYGLAFAKYTPSIIDSVNGALDDMKGDGALNDIYQKWFKIDAPKSVLGSTGADSTEESS